MSATIDAWRDSVQNPFALACVLSSQINAADARRKDQEQKAAATRSAVIERKSLEEVRARGPPAGQFKQVMETCEPLDTIRQICWKMTLHIEALLCETRAFVRIGYRRGKGITGPVGKGVFKKWSRKNLQSKDRVFTSRYVYKLKRSAITGEVYRFKVRFISSIDMYNNDVGKRFMK